VKPAGQWLDDLESKAERLEAENAKLRAALESIISNAWEMEHEPSYSIGFRFIEEALQALKD